MARKKINAEAFFNRFYGPPPKYKHKTDCIYYVSEQSFEACSHDMVVMLAEAGMPIHGGKMMFRCDNCSFYETDPTAGVRIYLEKTKTEVLLEWGLLQYQTRKGEPDVQKN